MNTARGRHSHHDASTRRSFFRSTLLGALVCNLLGERTSLRASPRPQEKRFDLLVKGGRVVDPSQNLSAPRDVAIAGHTVVKVAADIPEADALHVLDVK